MRSVSVYLLLLVVAFISLFYACQSKSGVMPALSPTIIGTPLSPGPGSKASPTPPSPVKPGVTPAITPMTSLPQTTIPYFQGKTIELIASSGAGGGTDMGARAVAAFLPKYLPGNPRIVVRNIPGGGGAVALNSFVEKPRPDGLHLILFGGSAISAQALGLEIVRYDVKKLRFIGSLGRAGTVLVIRKDALGRLTDPGAKAVVMVGREATEGFQAMPMWGREFLGWNVRWILGYTGTPEMELALRRSEADMWASPEANTVRRLVSDGIVTMLAQDGIVEKGIKRPRPDFPEVPVFANLLMEKGVTGVSWQSYSAWIAPRLVDKSIAAPPGTPDDIMGLLIDGYTRTTKDPGFDDLVKRTVSDPYSLTFGVDTMNTVKEIVEVPPEAADYSIQLQRKFGIIR